MNKRVLALMSAGVLLGGCEPSDPAAAVDAQVDTGQATSSLSLSVDEAPVVAAAGTTLDVGFTLTTPNGGGVAGVSLDLTIEAGGGSATSTATDEAGRGTIAWTLGVVPVTQKLTASYGPRTADLTVDATREEPLASEAFGEVVTFLKGVAGSTEDMVQVGDKWVLGAPGGLVTVDADGKVERMALTGDPIEKGWGLAVDKAGVLWVVDSGLQRLTRIDDGVVKVVMDEAEGVPFDGLNDVEVGPDGMIYATDPCTARLVRFDPVSGEVDAVRTFDLSTQGGPNGLTWDEAGRMVVTTENTSLLCSHGTDVAAFDAQIAHVFRLENTDAGLGEPTLIAEGLGVFGDGVTFDQEGNLYAITDSVEGFALDESNVWVLPGGEGPARKLLAVKDLIYANVGFGSGPLGETSLYMCLLAVPPFTTDQSLGLHRVELGIRGASWLNHGGVP